MQEKEIREQLCEIGRRMYERRMVAANDGNISVRLDGDRFLCTPTGVSKGYMRPEELCIVDGAGRVLDKGMGKGPSSELKLHLSVYKERADVNAVVHAHPPYATVFAVAGEELSRPIIAEAVEQFNRVPLAKYGALSTDEVPRSIAPYVKDYSAVLLEYHGAVTWGTSLNTAYMKMESLEFYAQMLYMTRAINCDRQLPPDRVEELLQIKKRLGIE